MRGDRYSEGDLVRLVAAVEGEHGTVPRGTDAYVILAFGFLREDWQYDLVVLDREGRADGALFEVPHDAVTVVERRRAF